MLNETITPENFDQDAATQTTNTDLTNEVLIQSSRPKKVAASRSMIGSG